MMKKIFFIAVFTIITCLIFSERQIVNFWYLWTGNDAVIVENIIKDFNESQTTYEVKGLQVPDVQKQIAAIASNSGPDVTDNFNTNIGSYASKGILMPLDQLMKRDSYGDDFIKEALNTCKYNGKTYGLPIGITTMMLYYNKDLLKEAGYDRVPLTDKELIEYSLKLTKKDSETGYIKTLGFPDFPFVYYPVNLTFALGGDFITKDGKTLTPDNPGTRKALELIYNFRKTVGIDNIQRFTSSAGGYVTPNDPFIVGDQALRIDGPWLNSLIKEYNPDLNFGIAELPYPEGHKELAGGGELSSSVMFIPSTSKNKEGAWAFIKYICGKVGMKSFAIANGTTPARHSLLKDPDIQKIDGFKEFAERIEKGNLKSFPSFPNQQEYLSQMEQEWELIINGKESLDDGLEKLTKKTLKLLK